VCNAEVLLFQLSKTSSQSAASSSSSSSAAAAAAAAAAVAGWSQKSCTEAKFYKTASLRRRCSSE
jgi:hypothetical protein